MGQTCLWWLWIQLARCKSAPACSHIARWLVMSHRCCQLHSLPLWHVKVCYTWISRVKTFLYIHLQLLRSENHRVGLPEDWTHLWQTARSSSAIERGCTAWQLVISRRCLSLHNLPLEENTEVGQTSFSFDSFWHGTLHSCYQEFYHMRTWQGVQQGVQQGVWWRCRSFSCSYPTSSSWPTVANFYTACRWCRASSSWLTDIRNVSAGGPALGGW